MFEVQKLDSLARMHKTN